MADRNQPPNSEDALANLRRRVDADRKANSASSTPADSPASLAMRFGGEFGAAILVGALLGFGVQYFIPALAPWGLIVGVGAGFATGVVNVVRVAQQFNQAHPPDPNARSIPDDDDD